MKRLLMTLLGLAALASSSMAAEPEGARLQPYAGLTLGMTLLDRTSTVGGVKLVDLGGDVGTGGIVVGVQRPYLGGLVLGVEASLEAATGRSRALINGDGYTYTPQAVYSVNGLVGWAPDNMRSRFFAVLGYSYWDAKEFGRWTPNVGIAAEIPMFGVGFVRPQLVYSWGGGQEYYRGNVVVGVRF